MLCVATSSVTYAEINVGITVEWLSHQSSLIARATPIALENISGPGDTQFTKTRFRLDEVIKGPQSDGDSVTIYDFSYNKADVLGLAQARKDKKQLLVFATVAKNSFKQIDGKYVLTQTRQFKSAYYPGKPIKNLFTPDFKLVSTYQDLLSRAKAQTSHEAALEHRYWNGSIVKKSLEVPFESQAHSYLYTGSTCYLWIPEYKQEKSTKPDASNDK